MEARDGIEPPNRVLQTLPFSFWVPRRGSDFVRAMNVPQRDACHHSFLADFARAGNKSGSYRELFFERYLGQRKGRAERTEPQAGPAAGVNLR